MTTQPADDSSATAENIDLYARDTTSHLEPPRQLGATLRYLGPGLILIGAIVGSGELIMTTKLGAQVGFVLLWFVILSCVIKTVVQAELARHVISSGETFLVMFNKLPGPGGRRPRWLTFEWLAVVILSFLAAVACLLTDWGSGTTGTVLILLGLASVWFAASRFTGKRKTHEKTEDDQDRPHLGWFMWVWMGAQLIMFFNGGAVLGGAGLSLELACRKVFGPTDARLWTIGVAVFTAVILLSGRYIVLERVSLGLVFTFTLITMLCTVLLQATDNAITVADLGEGMSFHLPAVFDDTVILTVVGMYAVTGIGAWEMMHYTYWCVEKGYARHTGANEPGEAWPRRARGWIRVMYWDAILTMILFTITTICFYFLGAAILHPEGIDPEGTDTIIDLEKIFPGSLGSWAATLFVIGAFVVLFSTTFSAVAGSSRLMADALCVMGLIDRGDYSARLRFIRIFIVFSLAAHALMYSLLQNPPLMLVISAFVAVVLYPILGIGTLYLRYCQVDQRIAPGPLTSAWLWICGLALAAISPLVIAIKQGWISL